MQWHIQTSFSDKIDNNETTSINNNYNRIGNGVGSKPQAQPIKNCNNEEYVCLICDEPCMEPVTEDWIQCNNCHQWYHEAWCRN
ncbi:hypothetical protein PoB_007608000 [Plakobranchus ocellatus]|uniref:Uncharacterized protein n=1 Tax=Plakobranchus ocellatus TaxID=259542 RepID=A0AAV4DZS9_9GAST|nr:hypothetical protein PoB_007608000 [Plakobranchus ocellatus]